ncbi:oxidoreductase [Salmonella enterica subsp. enterica]|uniref:Oxidoreductase n=1 Tax=Salmonella enterica I TaxID=59201 RepID=A0A379WUX3_SALET|nr:oxidoreductase [Salmonella enterica subsp. enterica]
MHYQPKQDLLQNRIILVTGASDALGGKPRSRMRVTAQR